MHKSLVVTLACGALLAAGCEQQRAAQENSAEVSQPQIEQAIAEANQRWLSLIAQKDSAGIANLYAEDGAFMAPNAPIATGRQAVQQSWQNLLAMPEASLTFETEVLTPSSSGDMAIDRGTYHFTANPESGAIDDTGKFVVVWRNVDGEWKVTHDIFNSNSPPG